MMRVLLMGRGFSIEALPTRKQLRVAADEPTVGETILPLA